MSEYKKRVKMHFKSLSVFILVLTAVFVTALGCASTEESTSTAVSDTGSNQPSFEVWAVDQSSTASYGTGGLIYIWDGSEISANASEATPEIIDLAKAAVAAGCDAPKKPHMILSNYTSPKASHVVLANVGSGDTFFINIESRTIVGCVNTIDGFNGAGGTANTHASVASPDNSIAIVANIGAKDKSGFLHKIQTDYTNDDYKLVETLALDQFSFYLGTSVVRPICHEFTEDSKFAYVTLAGGGVLVIDVGSSDGTTPMSLATVYHSDTVPGIGCGADRLPDGIIMTNGESGAKGGDDFLYIFNTNGRDIGQFPGPVQIELPGEDTHGAVTCTDQNGNLFAVTSMRVSNDVNFVDLQSNTVVATQSMSTSFSKDPKPDVADIVGNKMFIALRGAKPLSAIGALEFAGRTPGVAVLTINDDCKGFSWDAKDIASMDDSRRLVDGIFPGQQISAADPHGLERVGRV